MHLLRPLATGRWLETTGALGSSNSWIEESGIVGGVDRCDLRMISKRLAS
jgi:hypothetical protein